MARLCERPGCSEPALVAYGMRAEDLVFWLDALRPDTDLTHGVLCRRHADSMIVPRHWTLDDLREPQPRLFRAPAVPQAQVPTSRSTVRTGRRIGPHLPRSEQMTLDSDVVLDRVPEALPHAAPDEPPVLVANQVDVPAVAWTPTFDVSDDLDGLLAARSPLLARAFRGDDRPKPA